MSNEYSTIDENRMLRRRTDLLDKICRFCNRPYRTPPCDKSDHYWTSIIAASEAAEEPQTSSGCRNPAEAQAAILPQHRGRRHPYSGERPRWSGYCVIPDCPCECHNNEPAEEIEEML